jgi:hypothetical protein
MSIWNSTPATSTSQDCNRNYGLSWSIKGRKLGSWPTSKSPLITSSVEQREGFSLQLEGV